MILSLSSPTFPARHSPVSSCFLEQKKQRKLPSQMYGGGDNGGVDYGIFPHSLQYSHKVCPGFEISDMHRKGPHKKVRPNKNPLGFDTPFAKGVVIKTVIKKPKKPNSANRKVRRPGVWLFGRKIFVVLPVRVGEALQWSGVDVLRARGGPQPAGAQRGPHQSRQAAGRARSQDKVCSWEV